MVKRFSLHVHRYPINLVTEPYQNIAKHLNTSEVIINLCLFTFNDALTSGTVHFAPFTCTSSHGTLEWI